MSSIAANRLARICAYSAEAPEWEQFVRAVTPVVALSARRVSEIWGDASDATVSEIVQEVFLKLCEDERRILREFDDRGNDSFYKLLRTIAATVGTDHFRSVNAEKRGGRIRERSLDPEAQAAFIADSKATAAVEQPSLIAQLDNLLLLHIKSVTRRDRNLFWLYYRQGLTMDAIARIPAIGLTPKGVESALIRITKLLRETIAEGKHRKKSGFSPRKFRPTTQSKGFSPIVAIDSVKRR